MRWLGAMGCICALLLCGAGSASAETVDLGSKEDSSPVPMVLFFPQTLERAESFAVTVSAEPFQPLVFGYQIGCTRGSTNPVEYTSPRQPITPPFAVTILATLAEPDSCWVGLTAEAPGAFAEPGTVRIEVTGNRLPSPPPPPLLPPPPGLPAGVASMPEVTSVRCEGPDFLKRAHTESRGTGCAMAQRIATKAWNRPDRAGDVLRVSGFSCRRSRRGYFVEIRCTKTGEDIKVNGWLR